MHLTQISERRTVTVMLPCSPFTKYHSVHCIFMLVKSDLKKPSKKTNPFLSS